MESDHGVCEWATKNSLEREYHDNEWGKPVYDDQKLFEFITLEGAQAGLSWLVILKKRAGYYQAFDGYDLETLAQYDERRTESIIEQFDVVKHRGKINSVFSNAQAALKLQQEYGSLKAALWQFVDHEPIINHWTSMSDVPTSTDLSKEMSKFLKKKGFKFVGETICYSFMQAVGMVNDHLVDCPAR
ncbi:DNA-3-methyladenine glycosylase I [Vibrio sp. RC27]